MKNTLILTAVLAISLTSCKKETNQATTSQGTLNVVQDENRSLFDESKTYTYIAEDGSRANVSYQNEENNQTMTIKANNMKYVLDKKDADENMELYERNGVEVKLTKDSLKIVQDNLIIPMVLVK